MKARIEGSLYAKTDRAGLSAIRPDEIPKWKGEIMINARDVEEPGEQELPEDDEDVQPDDDDPENGEEEPEDEEGDDYSQRGLSARAETKAVRLIDDIPTHLRKPRFAGNQQMPIFGICYQREVRLSQPLRSGQHFALPEYGAFREVQL